MTVLREAQEDEERLVRAKKLAPSAASAVMEAAATSWAVIGDEAATSRECLPHSGRRKA